MPRIWLAVGFLVIALGFGTRHFVKQRNRAQGVPRLPGSFLLGNLKIAGECRRKFPKDSHPHNWSSYLMKKYGMGNVFLFDLWPLGPRFLFIANPEIASEYVTTSQSLPKSWLTRGYLETFLGRSIVTAEGREWKTLRSMFNPGFSASHLMTLVPYIVDASELFYDIMLSTAKSNTLIELEEYATRITIDIIGKVVLDVDFNSQKSTHPIVQTFRRRGGLMRSGASPLPWNNVDLLRPLKLWWNQRVLDSLINEKLDRKYASRAGQAKATSFKDRKRSVVDLALDEYEKEAISLNNGRPVNILANPQVRNDIVSSMKAFIFAGHDTTASTIAYAMYLIHFHPEVHKKLVAELDVVFGRNATYQDIGTAIKQDPYLTNRLEYLNAVLKETLRLFPPASTIRGVPAATDPSKEIYITDPDTGNRYAVSGYSIWPASHLIGRNEKYFPKCEQFIPERFIPSQTPFLGAALFTPAGKDAWRPFEKGPRNCIGQELAMIEAKIILALVIKDFDFVSEFDGIRNETWTPKSILEDPVVSNDCTIEGHRCYQMSKTAAKPVGGMPGRVSLRRH